MTNLGRGMPHKGGDGRDDLIDQLRRWGAVKVARVAANDDGPSAGDSVLARQRDLGLSTRRKQQDERALVGRAGEQRRRFMARGAGVSGLSMLPMWAVDPVPARNDASAPHERPPLPVDLMPDELHWIDRAISRLVRENLIRALILREEFTTTGTQQMKAGRVAEAYGGALTVRQYRYELQMALEWLRGRMAAA